jgi:trans-2-enoyl-CoA reductase
MLREMCVAYRLLEDHGQLKPGDAVILNAATSAVGTCVIQLCRMLKLRAIAVVRPPAEGGDIEEVARRLRALGASEVIPDSGSLKAKLDENKFFAKPRLGLDAVGGPAAAALADTLQDGCPVVVYGCMSGKAPQLAWQQWTFKELTVKGFNLRSWMTANKKKARKQARARGWRIGAGRSRHRCDASFAPPTPHRSRSCWRHWLSL